MRDKYLITLVKAADLKYSIIARKEDSEIPEEICNFKAKEFDGRFALTKDTSSKKDELFGISDTIHSAYKRIYNQAMLKVGALKEEYDKLGEIIVKTKINNKYDPYKEFK